MVEVLLDSFLCLDMGLSDMGFRFIIVEWTDKESGDRLKRVGGP